MNGTTETDMSTTNIGATVEDLLKSFDLLPEPQKHQVAFEILRRAYPAPKEFDDAQIAALYAECADADRNLAEEGIDDYEKGLVLEDAE
jgi:hypothetical protein